MKIYIPVYERYEEHYVYGASESLEAAAKRLRDHNVGVKAPFQNCYIYVCDTEAPASDVPRAYWFSRARNKQGEWVTE